MADLISKLNTLVKASIHGALSDDPDRSQRRNVPSLGKDIDQEIVALRQQIDSALDHEEKIKAEIESLQREAADWDQQADQALVKGDEATARYAVRQMQIKQQHVALQEADLAQHRISTSELISRVNELEAVVAEVRQQEAAAGESESVEADENSLAARLRRVREMFQAPETSAGTKNQVKEEDTPIDAQTIDDDLAQRRARLSQ